MLVARFSLTIGLLLLGSAETGAQQIAVRSFGTPDVQTTALVAEIGKPIDIAVGAGETVLAALSRRCGNNLAYLEIAKSRLAAENQVDAVNWSQTPLDVSKIIQAPACLPAPTPTLVGVKPGDNLTKIAKNNSIEFLPRLDANAYLPVELPKSSRETLAGLDTSFQNSISNLELPPITGDLTSSLVAVPGDYADNIAAALDTSGLGDPVASLDEASLDKWNQAQTTYAGITNNWAIRKANNLDTDFSVRSGEAIILPQSSGSWVSFAVEPGVDPAKVKLVENQLTAASQGQATESSPATVLVSGSDPSIWQGIGNDDCDPSDRDGFFAVSSSELASVMDLMNAELHRDAIPEGHAWPSILVLDTGFPENLNSDLLDQIFPARNRYKMTPFGGTISTGTLGALTQTYKINAATRSLSAEPPSSFTGERWHGLAVSLASLGGTELKDFRQRAGAPLPVLLGIASLLDDSPHPKVTFDAILNALDLANENSTAVVNASFMFPNRPGDDDDILRSLGERRILVVAAGNDGSDLNDGDYFPARMGGDPANSKGSIVITVGMVDQNGDIHPKSAFGKDYVDLFAPGCRIGSYTVDDLATGTVAEQSWTGTSVSAPQVSLLSALLLWYDMPARDVKARLYYSVKFDPSLSEKAYSSGTLDFLTSLAYPFDIISASDMPRKFGHVVDTTLSFCGRSFSTSQLARVSIRGQKIFFWQLPNNPSEDTFKRFSSCDRSDGDQLSIMYTEHGQTSPQQIVLGSPGNPQDIIFSYKR